MKRFIISISAAFLALSAAAQNADTTSTVVGNKLDFSQPRILVSNYFDALKADFSPEAREQWRPEFTLRGNAMLLDGSVNLTAGIRTSARRVFGVGAGWGQHFLFRDGPGSYAAQRMNFYLYHRHYFPLGRKQRFSFYSDLMGGGMWIYQVPDSYLNDESATVRPGDWRWWLSWQPGFAVRTWGRSNVFLGLSIGPTIGIHGGITL